MPRKATNEEIIESYNRLRNVWKVARELNMCGQSVHERLQKLNMISMNFFTEDDDERIKREYMKYRDSGKLQELADSMKRGKTTLCGRAKKLGLTDKRHQKKYMSKWKYMEEAEARKIFEKFKKSKRGTLKGYCKKNGYDDLGFARTMQKYFPDEWDVVIEARHPRQTMYRLGRAFEYRCRDYFKRIGYFTLRSPRSGGAIDVVAIKKGQVLFIQCKRSGQLGVKEWNNLFDVAVSVGAIPIMAEMYQTCKGIVFHRLVDKKDGSKKRQPMEDIKFD